MKAIKRTLAITLALCFIFSAVLHAQPTTQSTSPTFGSFEYANPDKEAFFERVLRTQAGRLRVFSPFQLLYFGMTAGEFGALCRETRNNYLARFNETHADTTYEEMLLQLIENSQEMWLPNRRLTEEERNAWIDHYWYHGGPTEHEKEIVRLINEIRREHRLQPVVWCNNLGMAARFYTQQQTQLGPVREERTLSHSFGPYGSSGNVARAFGNDTSGRSNGAGGTSAEGAVRSWMNSPGHRANLLSPTLTHIGVGNFRGGFLGLSQFNYVMLVQRR